MFSIFKLMLSNQRKPHELFMPYTFFRRQSYRQIILYTNRVYSMFVYLFIYSESCIITFSDGLLFERRNKSTRIITSYEPGICLVISLQTFKVWPDLHMLVKDDLPQLSSSSPDGQSTIPLHTRFLSNVVLLSAHTYKEDATVHISKENTK